MVTADFRVAVTGDTGYDVYTEYVEAYESDDHRLQKPEAAYDVYVPSGAAFTALTFAALLRSFPHPSIKIDYIQPRIAFTFQKENRVFSTLQKFLLELSRFKDHQSKRPRVLRVNKSRPILDKEPQQSSDVFGDLVNHKGDNLDDQNYDLLVLHDGAGSWRHYPPDSHRPGDALALVKKVLSNTNTRYPDPARRQGPRIIVNLNHDLPEVERDNFGELTFPNRLSFWKTLAEPENLDKICVICSVNMLRKEGAAVSRRLSFEQTVEDIATDLLLFEKIKILSRFKHLVIRLSMVGAVHIMTDDRRRSVDLVFAPLAKSGVYRDPAEDGTIVGQNAIIAAALTHMVARQGSQPCKRPDFVNALKSGLVACMRAFDNGYHVSWDKLGRVSGFDDGIKVVLKSLKVGGKESARDAIQHGYDNSRIRRDQILGHAVVPCDILDLPPGSWSQRKADWELLRNSIDSPIISPNGIESSGDKPTISRINVGVAIVLFGQERVLNQTWDPKNTTDEQILKVLNKPELFTSAEEIRDHITLAVGKRPSLPKGSRKTAALPWSVSPIHVPLMTFGKLVVVERKEIEAIRSIRNLFKAYIDKCAQSHPSLPPISVAVFGPPGSGKSFVVKELANDINHTLHHPNHGLEPIEYNVAQFRSVDELGDAITRASVINNEGKTPLIFFDEFDCAFDGSPLGWLKYFLAPMQDGKFYGVRQTIKIARAILVFAGGVYHGFDKFDPFSDSRAPADRRESEEAEKRLRAFVDQKGPDFVSRLRGHINVLPVDVDHGLVKPIIRRAIILRGLLVKRNLVARGRKNVAYIDEDVVYALLTLDRFRHGARSMDAIVEMCTPIQGKIEKSSLPSRAQLNMHIDAEEFFVRMYRGRFRSLCQRPNDDSPNGAVVESAKKLSQMPYMPDESHEFIQGEVSNSDGGGAAKECDTERDTGKSGGSALNS